MNITYCGVVPLGKDIYQLSLGPYPCCLSHAIDFFWQALNSSYDPILPDPSPSNLPFVGPLEGLAKALVLNTS